METQLSKSRILEIYFNVIEWAPPSRRVAREKLGAQRDIRLEKRTGAILGRHLRDVPFMHLSGAIHEADLSHHLKNRAAHGPRIHAQRAADASGDAFQEFQTGQVQLACSGGNGFEPCARAAMQLRPVRFDAGQVRVGQTNHQASNTAVAHQEIGTAPQNQEGDIRLAAKLNCPGQIVLGSRFEANIGAAADAQGGLFCQRFILAHRGIRQQSFQLLENPGWPRHGVKH